MRTGCSKESAGATGPSELASAAALRQTHPVTDFAPCASCDAVIASDIARCPYCRTDLTPDASATPAADERVSPPQTGVFVSDDGAASVEDIGFTTAGTPPTAVGTGNYVSPKAHAIALRIALLGWLVFATLRLGHLVAEYRLVDRILFNILAVAPGAIEAHDDRSARFVVVRLVLMAALAILFAAWTRRLYRNLAAFDRLQSRFRWGWAVGAWFTPVLNLFRPKQILDEVWRRSSTKPIPGISTIWWALWITATAGIWWATAATDTGEPSSARAATIVAIVGELALAAAAVTAERVVSLTTTEHRTRAASLGLGALPRDPMVPVRRAGLAGVAAVLFAGASFASFTAFDTDATSASAASGRTDSGSRGFEDFGISFNYPPSYSAAVASSFGGTASIDDGVVFLQDLSAGRVAVVSWANVEMGASDLVDILITNTSQEDTMRIERLARGSLPADPDPYVTRSFIEHDADGPRLTGAVAARTCTDGRLVAIAVLEDGDDTLDHATSFMKSLAATLDC